jgi:hypothetical protein
MTSPSPWRDARVATLIVARETALVHPLDRFVPPEPFRSRAFSDSLRSLTCEEIAESTVLIPRATAATKRGVAIGVFSMDHGFT